MKASELRNVLNNVDDDCEVVLKTVNPLYPNSSYDIAVKTWQNDTSLDHVQIFPTERRTG